MENHVNILIVDDRPENIIALEAILVQEKYDLYSAGSGREALELLEQREYAAVLLDVMMPEMDGFQLATIMKQDERFSGIPVLFLTAAAHDLTYIYKAYALGGVDYLHKPLDSNIVKAKVEVFAQLFEKNLKIKLQAEKLIEMEHRQQRQQLIELRKSSEKRYLKLTDAIPHIVWLISQTGELKYFNNQWLDYTGLSVEESRTFANIQTNVHPDDRAYFLKNWRKIITNGQQFEMECRLLRRMDNQYRWHLCRALPEKDSEGEVTAWICSFTDIEQHKRAEEELLVMRRLADAANEAKTQFLANMSHEIRTPLAAILGFAELILNQDYNDIEESLSWVETIKRNCQRLSHLIDEVLDISKIEAGQLETESSIFKLTDLLHEIDTLLANSARSKGLELEIDTRNLGNVVVFTDFNRLRQILINVVSNAIKFSDRGAISLSVSVGKDHPGQDLLVFIIQDQGRGLTLEQCGRLFNPFMQADKSTSRRYGGTGLGLAISKKLAKILGGDLDLVESRPNIGSTFRLTVPSQHQHSMQVSRSRLKREKDLEKSLKIPDLKGTRLLLVEDSEDNQIMIRSFLEKSGVEVDIANDGRSGIRKALDGDHDLILMDVQMPEVDGYQATSHLRAQGYRKPIIAITAHVMSGERERCIRSGYDEYLSKPVNWQKLLDVVAQYQGD